MAPTPPSAWATLTSAAYAKTVNLAFTPEVQPGDFVLVHVGFAITRIDEEEARRTFAYLKSIGALAEEGLVPPQEVPAP